MEPLPKKKFKVILPVKKTAEKILQEIEEEFAFKQIEHIKEQTSKTVNILR